MSLRRRVLVVDDNAGIREMLRVLCRADGELEIVGEAGDGEQAIAEAGRSQPDIVILDVEMPNVDGISAIPGIFAASPDTRIVVYSAYEQHRDEALAAGAHGWVAKGTDWATMRALLNGALADGHRPNHTAPSRGQPTTPEEEEETPG